MPAPERPRQESEGKLASTLARIMLFVTLVVPTTISATMTPITPTAKVMIIITFIEAIAVVHGFATGASRRNQTMQPRAIFTIMHQMIRTP
ncbi:hypothetical protein FOXG_06613 [Fusarium oxysporum f. sp. lycopersici 4287]|uniref:Uncharacterized protein n=1 Tax=Fusarium oxysporum f. sp. lycopersici (strain 4287 / CBS 123668 / FGSC 9935 / NRRL 34936) TaxID=426428 RepID=A0A0J9UZK8_FUSO4|nr:hypothetical protein FOXG_06613 [Fusarium oxysporum f. sp. lycopersici 4287]KNB04550.1 hypothetical protein FOXG_06613 [Fusarium oxysporum f. sp. lycopersici 4287]